MICYQDEMAYFDFETDLSKEELQAQIDAREIELYGRKVSSEFKDTEPSTKPMIYDIELGKLVERD